MIVAAGAVSVGLLAVGIGGTLRSPARLPDGTVAAFAAAAAIGLGIVGAGEAVDAVRPLVSPLLFLLLAAPLASMLDELDVFEAAASLATGRHLAAGCWVLAAMTVAALNLDTAVILLTPLYVTLARRVGIDPLALAAQPAILACLASSGLPVSHLTNLVGLLATGVRPRLRRGPFTTAAAAVALGVLASGVAAHVDIAALLGHSTGRGGELRTIGVGAGAAALTNNLPALLVLLPSAVGVRTVAALLLGVNLGPVVVVTGSLSGLLWMDAVRRAGLRVDALDYARFGLLAGGPALVAASVTFLLVR